ncbi:MAG: cyclic nucleotide-binding/CBS domain-containing protein [Rubrobacteridae bacterium]|nr:cyclic nucleotide-binding/CBS domain-containing protein [Rubrobacteridae bacterium]
MMLLMDLEDTLITQDIIEFLKQIPPFNILSERSLKTAAKKISMEFYPKGTEILSQAGKPSEFLYLIKKGGVKNIMHSGSEDVVVDYRSEGDNFGFISLYSGEKSRTNIVAIEDTICYLLDKDAFLKLGEANPGFIEFFLKSYLDKYSGKALIEVYEKDVLSRAGVSFMPAIAVKEMASRGLVSGSSDISIREAAQIMTERKVGSFVLVDSNKKPLGIITDKDLREKVVADAMDPNLPVRDIMSTNLFTVESNDYSFEALLKMIRHNIHHLLVMENGVLAGMITNHDLMVMRGTSPVAIAREIETQTNIEGLAKIADDITNLVGVLIKEGLKAINISRIMSELNDRLLKKIIALTVAELGPPPVPFCWIVYGSEGRKEQTFKTDQDNALIYDDADDASLEVEALHYFNDLAKRVSDGLQKCGFPACPADYMASNPRWCQPLKVWKRYFTDWMVSATPEALLYSTIFFDFRAVDGDLSLGQKLRDHLFDVLKDESYFLAQMAAIQANIKPPLGFFKTFVVEKTGEHKDMLNLKTSGIALLVDIVRLCSLEKGVQETSTLERLKALNGKHEMLDDYSSELEQAFEFLMFLRIVHQFDQIKAGEEPDNFIDPDKLSIIERHTLKEIFQLVSKIQDRSEQRHRMGAVTR